MIGIAQAGSYLACTSCLRIRKICVGWEKFLRIPIRGGFQIMLSYDMRRVDGLILQPKALLLSLSFCDPASCFRFGQKSPLSERGAEITSYHLRIYQTKFMSKTLIRLSALLFTFIPAIHSLPPLNCLAYHH